MNTGSFKRPRFYWIIKYFNPIGLVDFLETMRKYSYYKRFGSSLQKLWYKYAYAKASIRLGISIGEDCFGYGLTLHHYGTIVIGSNNRIGNFANINTSTNIIANNSIIGDFFFMGSGSVISKHVELFDNIKISANSLVNKTFSCSNVVLSGSPASIIKSDNRTWMELYSGIDGEWYRRYTEVQKLYKKMCL